MTNNISINLYKDKPTILHIVISLDTGGLERFVIDLVNATSNCFRHILLCLEQPGDLAKLCGLTELICLHIKQGIQFRSSYDIAKIARDRNVNLIHTHNEKAKFYGSIAGLIAHIPVIHTKHGKNFPNIRSRLRNKLSSIFCRQIVAVSDDAAQQCIMDEGIPRNKVMVILNGVNTDTFISDNNLGLIKTEFGIPPHIPVIGTVARLAPVKDQATLLSACQILKDNGCCFKLLLVGDGPLRRQLEEQAALIGLSGEVIFTGLRNDIPDLMNVMDLFVLSSVSEGISLTLAEAMACELPVVATSVGGNPEVVVDGETGFLVPPGDSSALAERISWLLDNEPLRLQMGKKGRKRAEERFSLVRAAEEYAALYRAVMGIA